MNPLIPLLLALLPAGTGGQEDPRMPFTEHLDQQQLVTLRWGFNDVQGIITFRLSVRTTGWVGFGFSPNGGMSGSDKIVIGGIGPDGKIYFSDHYATGNSLPLVDKQQSYTLLSLTEDDSHTIMTFQRSIQSCDREDFHITASPVKLIYAYGTTDDINNHGTYSRGTKEVNLLKYMPRTSLPRTDYMDIRVDNLTIPPIHTYYHCKVMRLPRLSRKHHIYQTEPAVENLDLVHHMVLCSCPAFVNETYDGPCYTLGKPDMCFKIMSAWSVGGGDYEFPENAGLPVGGEDSDMFYQLEIHYNNPTSVAGRRDSSGMRLYYTDHLRPHDVGIVLIGLTVNPMLGYKIPPSAANFHTYGTCNTSLFSKIVDGPVSDLHVFSLGLHTHLTGQKVRAGIFRNGSQVDFLSVGDNYNCEMQQVTNEGNVKTIKPGDEIVVECTYSTINRTEFTKIGPETTDELCLATLYYYPAIGVIACTSHPNMDNVTSMLESHPKMDNLNATLEKDNQSTSWDLEAISTYEELLKIIPQTQVASNYINSAVYANGIVRNLTKTPLVSCRSASDTPES